MLCIFICLSFCLAFFVCLFRFSLFFACASAPCFAAFGARGRFKGFGLSYYVWLCCAFALAAVRRQHPLVLRLLYYFPFPAAGLVTNALPLWGNRLVAGGGGLKVFLSFIKKCSAAGICHVMSGNAFHAVLVRLRPLIRFLFLPVLFPFLLTGCPVNTWANILSVRLYTYTIALYYYFLWQQACCQIFLYFLYSLLFLFY